MHWQPSSRWLWLPLIFLLTACEGGRGCFGLCDERDDDDDASEAPVSTVDRSCYRDSTLDPSIDLPYGSVDDAEQFVRFQNVASADTDALRPLLIWITGSTWRSGNEPGDQPSIAAATARELGAHLAVVAYRDAGDAPWPAQIQDVNGAVRFLRGEAPSRNIDPDRIILAGDQTGAHLAALSGTATGIQEFIGDDNLAQNNSVALLLGLGGLYDFETIVDDADAAVAQCGAAPAIADAPTELLFDCDVSSPDEPPLSSCDFSDLQQGSPLFHASSEDPPVALWHGELDCDFPEAQSQRFADTLADRALEVRYTPLAADDQSLDSLRANDVEVIVAELLPCDDP